MSSEFKKNPLNYKKIFILWVPLAAMWILMGIEMPMINAVIARLVNAKANLAAFGVTLSISLIIESPVIHLLATGTALADNKKNYRKLLLFMNILAFSLTLFHLIIGLTPLYTLLLKYIIKVPADIIPASRKAFIWMFPWSAAVGYRRLWQGVLIRYGKTKVIPLTMTARLIATSAILIAGFYFPQISGAEVGGIALSLGVIAGAVSSYIFVHPVIKGLSTKEESEFLSWNKLISFYYPLALTNFVTFIVRPVLSFGIARAAFPLESLAIWPVITSLMFLFRSMTLGYQEVAVSLLRGPGDFKPLSRFAMYLGLTLGAAFFLVSATPASTFWFKYAAGLENDLLIFTRIPTMIVSVIPIVTAMISWYRGILIYSHKTGIIARAVFLNSIILLVIILTGPFIFNVSGAVIAAVAYMFSMVAEALFLKIKTKSISGV